MNGIVDALLELRSTLSHHPLFAVGSLLVVGFFIGKLATRVKLPAISGYIIAGLFLGRTALGVVSHEMGDSLIVVTDVALGLIALTIGGEFYITKLKSLGKEVAIITVFQVVLTFIGVSVALWIFNMRLPFAIMMGAIATATAPAATVAIVQSLRAKGKFVDYLYGVVALDDAGAVIVFGISMAIATGILNPDSSSGAAMVGHAFVEIGASIIMGVVFGYAVHALTRKRSSGNELLIITLGVVFLLTACSIAFHLSPLLANMAAGVVIINASPKNHRLFRVIEPLTPPIYALFFVIAGTELDPTVLLQGNILILGSVYIIVRAAMKYFGVAAGAAVSKSPDNVRKYLGLGMIPQAGVAIGLVLLIEASPVVAQLLPADRAVISQMISIVLLSVFVNELIGPPLSKFAIVKSLDLEEK